MFRFVGKDCVFSSFGKRLHVFACVCVRVCVTTKRAACLQGNDPLASLLFQIASPAHIPWGDARWQELLHGYDVWVHMEASSEGTLFAGACQNMAKHSTTSSNLAALAMHVTRMLQDLIKDCQSPSTPTVPNRSSSIDHESFSQRISRVAKARATAGALQLLRLLLHPVIVRACQTTPTTTTTESSFSHTMALLDDVLTYHTRGDLPRDVRAGIPLIHSLLDWIAIGSTPNHSQTPYEATITSVAEVYDALVMAFRLLFVLLGTQLYLPFKSSFQEPSACHYALEELFRDRHNDFNSSAGRLRTDPVLLSSNAVRLSSSEHPQPQEEASITHWTPQRILTACLEWSIRRPPAPNRSIAQYHARLAQQIVDSKGETRSPDGLYETHLIVQAVSPILHDDQTKSSSSSVHHPLSRSSQQPEQQQLPRLHEQHLKHHPTDTLSLSSSSNIFLDATRGVLVLSSSIISLPFRLVKLVLHVWGHHTHRDQYRSTMTKKISGSSTRTMDVLWLSDSPLADLANGLVLLVVNNHRNKINPFRTHLKHLVDNRWEQSNGLLPDLPLDQNGSQQYDMNGNDSISSLGDILNEEAALMQGLLSSSIHTPREGTNSVTVNFESLFASFGRILHTEVGALLLYTLIQSCPAFAASLAVRSDLDTLVLPLLRTLYFSSATRTFVTQDYRPKGTATTTKTQQRHLPSQKPIA